MINKVYKDAKVELPDLETNEIDIADSYQLSSFTGLENNNNIDFVVVSEPLMNAQAYSLIVVKLKDKIFHSHSRQKSCFTLGFVAKIVSYGKYYK